MKKVALFSLAVMIVTCAITQVASPQRPNAVGPFMRLKLVHSQKVLEAIVTEDYAAISKHAQEMSLLSQAAQWKVLQTPQYAQQSSDFRRIADSLTTAGKDKNLDAAALAYVKLTLSCVDCHKYVRNMKTAQLRELRLDLGNTNEDSVSR